MSVRMRHTSGHTRNRRSHHGLSEPRLSACGKCGASHIRHTMCQSCGTYRDREVIDMKRVESREAARKARKIELLKQQGVITENEGATDKKLDAEALSTTQK